MDGYKIIYIYILMFNIFDKEEKENEFSESLV